MAGTRVQTPEDLTARTSPRPLTPLEAVARPTDPYYRPTTNPTENPAGTGEFGDLVRQLNIVGPQIQSGLQDLTNKQNEKDVKAGIKARLQNQKSFKDAVAAGQLPEAGNPWFVKGYMQQDGRLSAMEYDQKLRTDWASSPVKDSHNPNDLTKFMADSRESWMSQHKQGQTPDWMDGFIPGLHQAEANLNAQHIAYRQQEISRQVRENTANEIGTLLDNQTDREKGLSPNDPLVQASRDQTAGVIQQRVSDLVKQGLNGTDANKIIAETVIAKGETLSDETYARGILTKIETPGGNVAKIADVTKQLNTSERHIIDMQHQQKQWQWQSEDRPYHELALKHSMEVISHQKDEWAIQAANQDKKVASDALQADLMHHIISTGQVDPIKLARLIDIDPQGAKGLLAFQSSEADRKEKIVTDKSAASNMMVHIISNPEAISVTAIYSGVKNKVWDYPIAMQMEAHREEMLKIHRDPSMQDPVFKVQLEGLKSSIKADVTNLSGSAQLDAANAEVDMMNYWKNIQNDPDKYGKLRLKQMDLIKQYNPTATRATSYTETPGTTQPPKKTPAVIGPTATPYEKAKASIPDNERKQAINFLINNPGTVREFEANYHLPAGMGDEILRQENNPLKNRTFN